MRIIILGLSLAACIMLGACSGSGSNNVFTGGRISGSITVGGPFNGALELLVGLVDTATGTVVQHASAGHVTSAATGGLSGREVSFSFDQIPLGSYKIAVYYQPGADPVFLYQSAAMTVDADHANVTGFTDSCSFTGAKPWGTISGRIALSGTWPADQLVFVGFTPHGTSNTYQFIVNETGTVGDTTEYTTHQTDGVVVFNVAYLAYGSYDVGLFTYNPVSHAVGVCGLRDVPITLTEQDANATHVNFPADFAGDPGVDPALGSISGTITFDGVLPAYLETSQNFISVAANTFPPQQGAPPSDMKIKPSMLSPTYTVSYELPDLPYGDYNVSVFLYDLGTHTPVYLGWLGSQAVPGHVLLSAATPNVSGIDFNATVAPLQ